MRPHLVLALLLSSCASTPPPAAVGAYQDARFTLEAHRTLQTHLLRLKQLESAFVSETSETSYPAVKEAKRIMKEVAAFDGVKKSEICDHMLWMLGTPPAKAAMHEIYLLEFIGRALQGGEVSLSNTSGSETVLETHSIDRRSLLRVLIDKALDALAPTQDYDLSFMYGALTCEILERVDWGDAPRIASRHDPDSPNFRSNTVAALKSYRERLPGR